MSTPGSSVDKLQADADRLARASPILLTLHMRWPDPHPTRSWTPVFKFQNDNLIGMLWKYAINYSQYMIGRVHGDNEINV
jgi:hypothetical protein